MQALIDIFRVVPVLLYFLIATGCAQNRSVFFRSSSPDSSATLELVTFLALPSGKDVARWELSTASGRIAIQTWKTSDMNPCFAAVDWSADSAVVIALYRDCWHGSELVAFDLKAGRRIAPGVMKTALADKIRSEYAVRPTVVDPIAWAKETAEAKDAFAKAKHR